MNKKNKKVIISFLAALMIVSNMSGCSTKTGNDSKTSTTSSTSSTVEKISNDEMEKYNLGKPWICSNIKGVVTEDNDVSLKDDFYTAVLKDKLANAEISDGERGTGTMSDIVKITIQNLLSSIEKYNGDDKDEKNMVNLYDLFMDWDGRNEVGKEPLKELIDSTGEIKTIEDMTEYLTFTPKEKRLKIVGFDFLVDRSVIDSSKHEIFAGPANDADSLVLGDSAEYREKTSSGERREKCYGELVKSILEKIGYSEEEAETKFANCLEYEGMLSEKFNTIAEQKSPEYVKNLSNVVSYADFVKAQGNYPAMDIIVNELNAKPKELVLVEPESLEVLSETYTDENVEKILDAMIVHTVIDYADYLDEECHDLYEKCINEINGINGSKDYKEKVAAKISELLPFTASKLYCEEYFKDSDKERMKNIIDDVVKKYKEMLEKEEFISDEMKEKAIEKLESLRVRALYPDDWTDYSYDGLNVATKDKSNLFDEMVKLGSYKFEKMMDKYGTPVNKNIWEETVAPIVVNAGYMPTDNSINICACFCQGELYNSNMSDEEVFGKIGMVIGHEISHAFDSSGGQFDKDGNVSDWWTDEDKEKFDEKNKKLSDYYSSFTPWEDQSYDGSFRTGEACADMSGMKCMLGIAKDKDSFDYDSFFRSYADMWFVSFTPEEMQRRILQDEHPVAYMRVNAVLQQFDDFLEEYDIKESDGMYLAPEDRVTIW